MAFDVVRRTQDGKDWSMGGDWKMDVAVDRFKSSLPVKAVAVGAAASALWLLWPQKTKIYRRKAS